jgi:hypothetical protein
VNIRQYLMVMVNPDFHCDFTAYAPARHTSYYTQAQHPISMLLAVKLPYFIKGCLAIPPTAVSISIQLQNHPIPPPAHDSREVVWMGELGRES